MNTQSQTGKIPETMDDFCQRVARELSNFYNRDRWPTISLDNHIGAPDPSDLPIESTAFVGADSQGNLYSDMLLPGFLDFAETHGHAILSYDRRHESETFPAVLEKAVHDFSDGLSPFVFDGRVYYVRLTPKAGYSLPSDIRRRRDYIETHSPFGVSYYRHSEEAFFKLCAYYVNLYAQNQHTKKTNAMLEAILLIGGLILIAALGYLGLLE